MRNKEWNAAPSRWGVTACCRHRRRRQEGPVTREEEGGGQQGLHKSWQGVEGGGGRRINIPIGDQFHPVPLRHELSPQQQLAGKGLRTWPATGTLCRPRALPSQPDPRGCAWTVHSPLRSLFKPRPALLDPGDAVTSKVVPGGTWAGGEY